MSKEEGAWAADCSKFSTRRCLALIQQLHGSIAYGYSFAENSFNNALGLCRVALKYFDTAPNEQMEHFDEKGAIRAYLHRKIAHRLDLLLDDAKRVVLLEVQVAPYLRNTAQIQPCH